MIHKELLLGSQKTQPIECLTPSSLTLSSVLAHSAAMKSIECSFTFSKRFYFVFTFILISAVSISGPFISFFGKWNQETRVILHPFDATKDTIQDKDYAIIFDGGSTGTRIHIFTFLINQDVKQRKILLHGENYFYTKPGLSSFAHNISGAASSLEPLLAEAYKHVPSLLAPQTPLILKATAGLRLLSDDSAEKILNRVETKLRSSPFKVDNDAVSMLDEKDEGLYAWYTVNHLLDKLHNISESIATLDLGGGSTQVTFSTNDMQTLVMSPPGYISKRNIEGEPEFIYTYSYLGSGLMSARQSIMLDYSLVEVEQPTDTLKSSSAMNYHILSPCFKTLANETHVWKFNENLFHVNYDNSVVDSFAECYEQAQDFVERCNIDKAEELSHRIVYAMSYFYDRMKDIKVIKHDYGYIKVRDYFLYAEHVCNGSIKLRKQSAFLCLDLTYIAAYLHDGLGLPLHKDILLIKKFNGYEISWALGAAINLFDFNQ